VIGERRRLDHLVVVAAVICSLGAAPTAASASGRSSCVRLGAEPFGIVPLGTDLRSTRRILSRPCSDRAGVCVIRGRDGVEYEVIDGFVASKTLHVTAGSRLALGLTARSTPADVERRLRTIGGQIEDVTDPPLSDPSPHVTFDGSFGPEPRQARMRWIGFGCVSVGQDRHEARLHFGFDEQQRLRVLILQTDYTD
jgi:hypothetical protein